MMRSIFSAIMFTTLIIITLAPAGARPAHHRGQAAMVRYLDEQLPLTVNRRSFLDPGPAVPVGSLSNYIASSITFNGTPDPINNRSAFGIENLPAPLEVPGRPSAVLEWYAPRLD